MNWRDRLTALRSGAKVFLHSTRTLLWDISARELGIKQAIVDVARTYEEFYAKTEREYSFDEKVIVRYADSLMEIYAVHHLVHLLGLSVFHEQIMDLEIRRRFGPPDAQPPLRIDRRDLATLAKLIKQNEEITYGQDRKEPTRKEPTRKEKSKSGTSDTSGREGTKPTN